MDATGLTAFSALPLFPLMLIFWHLESGVSSNIGFVWGRWRHYGLAIIYPLAVLSLIAFISLVSGAADLSHTDWMKASLNLILGTVSTFVIVIITEEGFFRGWLWSSLENAGQKRGWILIISSVAFSLWHLSWVTLTTDGKLPVAQIPIFIVNAAIIGTIWGLLRWISGSVIVASLSHGLWNGITYLFFGFGIHTGALGIKETIIYGPEIGLLGLVLNSIFAVVFWRWVVRSSYSA